MVRIYWLLDFQENFEWFIEISRILWNLVKICKLVKFLKWWDSIGYVWLGWGFLTLWHLHSLGWGSPLLFFAGRVSIFVFTAPVIGSIFFSNFVVESFSGEWDFGFYHRCVRDPKDRRRRGDRSDSDWFIHSFVHLFILWLFIPSCVRSLVC